MGLVRTTIQLSNPRDGSVKPVDVRALVDTGAMHLCIPEHVALQLRLERSPGAPALDKRNRTSKSLSRSRARRVDLLRRPRPPCGPAYTAGPQWLDASRSSATADYAPALRSPWRAAVGALVLGDEVLLGAVPMEDMDLVISPSRQTVVVNPESPNIPSAVVKGFFADTPDE